MPDALDVVGRLMVEMGDASARVEARGDTIDVELPSLRAGYSILRRLPGGRGRREAIRRVHEGLLGAGLGLCMRVGPEVVGRLGVGARAGRASRLLGFGPLEIRLDGLLASRRRHGGRPGS
jgi:hypothetical protein